MKNIGFGGLCLLAGVAFILVGIIGAITGSIETEQEHILSHKTEALVGLNQDESATSSEFEEFMVAGVACLICGAWLRHKKKSSLIVMACLSLLAITGCARKLSDQAFLQMMNQKGVQTLMAVRGEVREFVQNGGDPAQAFAQSRMAFSPEMIAEYKKMGMSSAQILSAQLMTLDAVQMATYSGTMFSSRIDPQRLSELNRLRNDCFASFTNSFAAFLNDSRADMNWRDWRGKTMLMNVAEQGNAELVKALIAKGANLNLESGEGKTAADYAHDNKQTSVVELLRSAGAKNIRSNGN